MRITLKLLVGATFFLTPLSLGQKETTLFLRTGYDLGCQGPGAEMGLRQVSWSYGLELYACPSALRSSLRVAFQPFPFFPLEVSGYGGALGSSASLGLLLGGWVPVFQTPEGWELAFSTAAGLGLTWLPTGNLLPGLRLNLGLEVRLPVLLSNLSEGFSGSAEGPTGASCVAPTAETLMATFTALAESTRSAVIASLSALYTDLQVELSDLEVTVEGSQGTLRGRYVVGATHRLTGTRHTYRGQGVALFRHNGCSWTLVSYRY